jgi:hypothetical protein
MAHRLDQIVDSLFAQENDRALARAWVARLEADGVGERTEALLREAALTTKRAEGSEMTQVQAREYLSDFARTIGVLDHQIGSSIAWVDSGAPEPAAAFTNDVEIERRIGQQDAARYEKMMRERPQEYWSSPQHQSAYLSALERANAVPPPIQAAAPAPAPAEAAPAAAPAAAAPAPAPAVEMRTEAA